MELLALVNKAAVGALLEEMTVQGVVYGTRGMLRKLALNCVLADKSVNSSRQLHQGNVMSKLSLIPVSVRF